MGIQTVKLGDVAIGNVASESVKSASYVPTEIYDPGNPLRLGAKALEAWGRAGEAIGMAIGARFQYKEKMLEKRRSIADKMGKYLDQCDHEHRQPNQSTLNDFEIEMKRYDHWAGGSADAQKQKPDNGATDSSGSQDSYSVRFQKELEKIMERQNRHGALDL